MEQFLIPSGEGTSEYMEKKSRFLGLITPVTTEAEARARLEAVKKQEYDARHNCWAYILHSGQKRYSDDGEPQGTAGQPILNVLEREGVQDVLCVVTRYFGGILLRSLPRVHEGREGRAGRRGHLRTAPMERTAARLPLCAL
jgi:putative IMPACT (imprinted ancient) family translation regulator